MLNGLSLSYNLPVMSQANRTRLHAAFQRNSLLVEVGGISPIMINIYTVRKKRSFIFEMSMADLIYSRGISSDQFYSILCENRSQIG